jgi:Uma2 family endonuclease
MAVLDTTSLSLESGDRLTRAEFHRVYCARKDIKKAELVEGVAYVPSPARLELHAEPHGHVVAWLGVYKSRTPGVRLGDNATVLLDDNNELQPDACLLKEEPGGPRLTKDGYIRGAPQLIVEIAVRSAAYDLHDKMEAYRRNGVREYIVWRTLDGLIDWFRLTGDQYEWVEPDDDGVVDSEVFPGLCLDVPRMLAGDLGAVLAMQERRIAKPKAD